MTVIRTVEWLIIGHALYFCDSNFNLLSRARCTLDLILLCSKTEDELLSSQSLFIVKK